MNVRSLGVVLVLAGAAVSAAALVANSAGTATPVEVENGSTYEVGTVLQFDVPNEEGDYELFSDGDFVAVRRASDGTIVWDTDGGDPGEWTLIDADTGEAVYAYELTAAEDSSSTPTPTPTQSPTPTPDTVAVENGSTYETGITLEFDVPKEEGEYEFRTTDGEWIGTRQASDGSIVESSSYFDPGEYELFDPDTGEIIYVFGVTTGDASPTPTPTPTQSPTPTPDTVAVENGSTYEVGTVLQFDVPKDEGEYELFSDGDFVAVRRASDGTIVWDTDGDDPGEWTLIDVDTGETVYAYELAAGEAATTPSPSPTSTAAPDADPTGTETPTAQHDQAGTETESSRQADGTGRSETDTPSPRPTTDSEATPPASDANPAGSTTDGPDRTTTAAPGFGPVATLVAVVVALVMRRRGEP